MNLRWLCPLILAVAVLGCDEMRATECRSLYGIHDADPDPSEYLNHIKAVSGCGWITATVAVGHDPADIAMAGISTAQMIPTAPKS